MTEEAHAHKFVIRKRLNEKSNGYIYTYWHCKICGENEFSQGDRKKFDEDLKKGMIQ